MSEIRFDGRVAIVTAAGTERGRPVARILAERGAQVVVNDDRPGEAARVAKEIEDRGGTAMPNSDGVGSPDDGQAIVDAALEAFGGLDIVVQHSQGPSGPTASSVLAATDPDQLLADMFGGYWLARPAFIHMRTRDYGRLVFACALDRSIAAHLGEGNTVAAMGLMGLMNILKVEGPQHDIKLNMVVPAASAEPAALGDVVAYLASEECAPTGEIFSLGPDGLARMFMGVTEGYFDSDLTPETVRDRVQEFLDPSGFFVPDEASGEITVLKRDLNVP